MNIVLPAIVHVLKFHHWKEVGNMCMLLMHALFVLVYYYVFVPMEVQISSLNFHQAVFIITTVLIIVPNTSD